jgi:PAS domain S-box-containing protein
MPSSTRYFEHFEELKRFVRFGSEDAALLRELCSQARPHFEDIAREFYERVREHDEAHAVFADEAQIARLHESLVAWLERVLSGPYDESYCEKSVRIGSVHVRVGLAQRFMFAAMTLFRLRLETVAAETMGQRAHRTCQALSRILEIELALMNESYREALAARALRLELRQRDELVRAAEQSHERYVRAVELAGVVIIGLDREGRIRLFNREAERVTGYAFDEVEDKLFTTLVSSDDGNFEEAWEAAQRTQDAITRPVQCAIVTRTGKIRELAGHLSRADGEASDVILAGRDVTGELALAVRVRRSEHLAAVGTLAAGLAHEIRNPLNGARLHLTYMDRALQRNQSGEEVSEAIGVVAAEIDRLSALVSEFLDFARPDELDRRPSSIQELCQRAMMQVDPDPSTTKLSLELPKTPILAEIDSAKMTRVLVNLLNNAIESVSAAGGGHVLLRGYREPRQAVLEVHDDGPGLPSPAAPIFDAFYSTKPGGTGLGLAIAHRIVSDHLGSIDFESRPGQTTFRVTVPLHAPDRLSESAIPPQATAETPDQENAP